MVSPSVALAQANVDQDGGKVPRWEDYVPPKYQNPRTDVTRGGSIAELSVGIALTDLIITCPIGIPMICHARTNIKHVGYVKKKQKFEKGLEEGKQIKDPIERQKFYDQLVKDCNFKDIPKNRDKGVNGQMNG